MDSPKACVKQGHPGPSISGAAEQEVLPDGHVTDEGEDEQHHAEHDEPQGAGYTHHSAPLPEPALSRGHQDAARRTQAAHANRTRTPDRLQGSSAEAEHLPDGRDTSAGSTRPRSQTVATKTAESTRPRFCGSTRRSEGATELECDALTVDAERRETEGGRSAGLCSLQTLS